MPESFTILQSKVFPIQAVDMSTSMDIMAYVSAEDGSLHVVRTISWYAPTQIDYFH